LSEESFVSYRNYRWMWLSVLLMAAMTVVYFYDKPIGGRNGGTIVGYTYGGFAAAAIAFLMWYGMRKRYSYNSRVGTLKGWLAAHIWLGISLSYIVLLHSGFQVGLNVHTLAYVLMVLTIISGIWGAIAYVKLPHELKARREGITPKINLEQIDGLSQDMSELARGKGDSFSKLLNRLDFAFNPSASGSMFARALPEPDKKDLTKFLEGVAKNEYDDALKLISMAHRRRELCNKLINETRTNAWLKVWLYVHLPISFACVAALIIHIFSVFFYW
jgi:hypothetical protein